MMKQIIEDINRVLAKWDPLGVSASIALDEYQGCIPLILKSIRSREKLKKCLEDILINELGVDYDPTNKEHLNDLQQVCEEIMQIYHTIYLNFLREKGRPLSEINPGSDEIALAVDDALQALDLLDDNTAILGGEILSEKKNGNLVYAYQLWGYRYHYLNWYCDKRDNESQEDYIKRSYITAKESIEAANNIAKRLGKKCYIVIVI